MSEKSRISATDIRLGLERITAICSALGNPQNDYPCVHVGGTNGKGSVCAYLESILVCAGLRVGVFSSPPVFGFDNVRVSGKLIDSSFFDACIREVDALCIDASPFERETAAAFLCFRKKACDIAIIEAGMGGRLDATNVTANRPLTILTSIGLEHCSYLGSTIDEIAVNKAGLISSYLITSSSNAAATVLESYCRENGYGFRAVPDPETELYGEYISLNCSGFTALKLATLASYQAQNAALAIEAAAHLSHNFAISDEAIRRGIESATIFGRFERIHEKPDFYIDGAHNPAAADMLRRELDRLHSQRISYIYATFSDKAYEDVLRRVALPHSLVYLLTAPTGRGVSAQSLKGICDDLGYDAVCCMSPNEAVQRAFDDENDTIVAFGSLSILNSVKQEVKAYERTFAGKSDFAE